MSSDNQQGLATVEADYVAKTVGCALSKGLAEIILKKPSDPVEFLATFLYKYAENMESSKLEIAKKQRIEQLLMEQEIERENQERMRAEKELMQRIEEEIRKEREAEEKLKKEQEEKEKKNDETKNVTFVPTFQEEDIPFTVFGENKLHEFIYQCAEEPNLPSSEVPQIIRELKRDNYCLASRNSEFLTPRDVAEKLINATNSDGIKEIIKEIDKYIHELLNDGNFKELEGYLINGFTNLKSILISFPIDEIEDETLKRQISQFINVKIPQIEETRKKIVDIIDRNDVSGLEALLNDHLDFLAFRDAQGLTLLHLAIETFKFDIGLYLASNHIKLLDLNDSAERYPHECLEAIDKQKLTKEQLEKFEQLLAVLQPTQQNS